MLTALLGKTEAKSFASGEEARAKFERYKWFALFGAFFSYAGYYLVRNNLTFSTPYLNSELGFSKQDIGFISATMLISYGLAKGYMSVLADRCDPKKFLIVGMVMSAVTSITFGFAYGFSVFVVLAAINGLFQGMGAGSSFILLAKWFPKKERGRVTALWNVSHNVGGGLVSPIITTAIILVGAAHWQTANYILPAVVVIMMAVIVWFVGRSIPEVEGLPPRIKAFPEESVDLSKSQIENSEKLTTGEALRRYVLPNAALWFVSFVDVFVYAIRFGVLTFLPLYLLKEKGFSKTQMGVAFLAFEWAAIPSTMLAGWVSDKLFRGQRMPVAIASMLVIGVALYFYWSGTDIAVVTAAAAIIGCFIYVPQFLASVQTMEVVPVSAVGAAVGLRGLLSYILGASAGTALIGYLSQHYGWVAGFYFLMFCVVACALCALGTHICVSRDAARTRIERMAAAQPAE